jgi:hypothetical protein
MKMERACFQFFPEGTASLRTLAGVVGHIPAVCESLARRMCSPSRQAIFIETAGIRLEEAVVMGYAERDGPSNVPV